MEDSDPDLVIEDSNSSNDEEFLFSQPVVQTHPAHVVSREPPTQPPQLIRELPPTPPPQLVREPGTQIAVDDLHIVVKDPVIRT